MARHLHLVPAGEDIAGALHVTDVESGDTNVVDLERPNGCDGDTATTRQQVALGWTTCSMRTISTLSAEPASDPRTTQPLTCGQLSQKREVVCVGLTSDS